MYPHERSLVKAMESKPFVLLGVNSDVDKDKLRKRIREAGINWRSWWDGGSRNGPIATRFGVKTWPTLIVLDHNGIIRHKWAGGPGEQALDEAVEKLVKAAEKEAPEGAKKGGK